MKTSTHTVTFDPTKSIKELTEGYNYVNPLISEENFPQKKGSSYTKEITLVAFPGEYLNFDQAQKLITQEYGEVEFLDIYEALEINNTIPTIPADSYRGIIAGGSQCKLGGEPHVPYAWQDDDGRREAYLYRVSDGWGDDDLFAFSRKSPSPLETVTPGTLVSLTLDPLERIATALERIVTVCEKEDVLERLKTL